MKKLLLTIFIIFLASPFIQADNYIFFNITQGMSVSQIQTELQTVIDNATIKDTVIVTGSKTNADAELVLHIIKGIRVVWRANYLSSTPFGADNLISFTGDGLFAVDFGALITENANAINAAGKGSYVIVCDNGKVQTSGDGMNAITTYGSVFVMDNAQLSSTTGETIASNSDNASVLVGGGTISATSENAIITWGKNAQILISGGHVYNNADVSSYVINAAWSNNAFVHVSGNAIVEAKGYGFGIYSAGNAQVSGNAQVHINKGGNDPSIAAVRAVNDVTVTDNAKVSASNNCAIYCFENVTVSWNAIVEAKNDAIAIKIYGESGPTVGYVTVTDNAQVIAAHNYAISSHNAVVLNGGVVFAYGNEMSHIINNEYFFGTTRGVILAWNKDAGNTKYEKFSTDDLFISPETATAHWDFIGGKAGISYANGTNTGFIPIEEVSIEGMGVKPITNDELRITVYPNPTTGELYIQSSKFKVQEFKGSKVQEFKSLKVQSVEVFDVYGRKIKHSSAAAEPQPSGQSFNPSIPQSFNISGFPSGFYFVKIATENGVVVKKVVKE